ncbi:uncharacterized protein LOC114239403 [Bombyx mandarina]|uniref:Uncharacterized protein LOC114239403 n=1 Tax=Bombyx mandarina TaxID=7092 RepID=A0A6J2J9Y3_BOMMA|nr:uncharacterized protein LOC114239403 [Bombyx mandarina]
MMFEQMSLFSSGMEAMLQRITESMSVHRPSQSSPTRLVNFDPDEPEADVVSWCTLSEMIIEQKKLDGVDLILTLTHSLKARAATCLTKIQPAKPEQPPHPWAPGSRLQVSCYVCGDASHVASGCSMRYKKKNVTAPGAVAGPTRDVNVCSRASVCYR